MGILGNVIIRLSVIKEITTVCRGRKGSVLNRTVGASLQSIFNFMYRASLSLRPGNLPSALYIIWKTRSTFIIAGITAIGALVDFLLGESGGKRVHDKVTDWWTKITTFSNFLIRLKAFEFVLRHPLET